MPQIYKVSNAHCCKQHTNSDAVGFFGSASFHPSQHMDELSRGEASLIVITLSTLAIRKSLYLYTDGFMLQCYKCAKFHGFTTWYKEGAWAEVCTNLLKSSPWFQAIAIRFLISPFNTPFGTKMQLFCTILIYFTYFRSSLWRPFSLKDKQ